MKRNAILSIVTVLLLSAIGMLVQAQRRAVQVQAIDVVLRQMSVAFRHGDIESVRVLCTSDCAPRVAEWMTAVSNALSSSLGWHPLTDPPPPRNPTVEGGYGMLDVDYFPNARWEWPSPYGRFYRFRQEGGVWRYAGYQDEVQ